MLRPINLIASGINDDISLNNTTKCFRNHYNKICFFMKLLKGYLHSMKGKIYHEDYILVNGSDIQKKYAKMMAIGLGYLLMVIVHFGKDGEMTTHINKLYNFDHVARS